MSPSGPKLPPRRKGDLDQPWQAGDSIPAPVAVSSDGDSAWALWNEVRSQQEARFAPTAPMSIPSPLSTHERAWAVTQPGARVPLPPPARPPAQAAFTLDAAMLVARKNNRVCPRPQRWEQFSAMLPPRKTLRGQALPPVPATGAAWSVTPPLTKRLCFREQIEWAERAGLLEAVMAFMQTMREDEWLHMGED